MTDRIEVYETADGWRWRRVAGNNEILSSGEAHTRFEDARRAAWRANPDLRPAEADGHGSDSGHSSKTQPSQ